MVPKISPGLEHRTLRVTDYLQKATHATDIEPALNKIREAHER